MFGLFYKDTNGKRPSEDDKNQEIKKLRKMDNSSKSKIIKIKLK